MKDQTLFIAAALCSVVCAQANAESVTANVSLTSDYISRGFTQTWSKPALQGGVDYAHESGVYVGTWASTISDTEFRDGSFELDVYAGYTGTLRSFGYTAGFAYYAYPGSSAPTVNGRAYDYAEVKLGTSYGSASLTGYVTVTNDWFGTFDDAQGSYYVDATLAPAFGAGYTLQIHAGAGRVHDHSEANWTDAKLGITKALDAGWSLGGAVTRGWDKDAYWTGADFQRDPSGNTYSKRLGDTAVVVSVARVF
jgi:uncharacterized protein (TIGR02001 family)